MLTIRQIDYLNKRIEIFNKAECLYKIDVKKSPLTPYFYGTEISEYIDWMYEEELVVFDCYEIKDDFIKNYLNDEWYKSLSQKQIIQCLALIIRQDRFNDGLAARHIEDGTFGKLITQLKSLL